MKNLLLLTFYGQTASGYFSKSATDFQVCEDVAYIELELLKLWELSLNVGPDQLARSILILSAGDISIFREIFETDFYGDPRDVITRAESKLGNPKDIS